MNTYINDGYYIRPDARSFYTADAWNSMSEKQRSDILNKIAKISNGNNYYQSLSARGCGRTLMFSPIYFWHLESKKLLLNKMNLDDIRLFFKRFWNAKWWWYSTKFRTQPISFTEFLDNRSLSRYIQKARKEVNKNAKIYINHTRKQ